VLVHFPLTHPVLKNGHYLLRHLCLIFIISAQNWLNLHIHPSIPIDTHYRYTNGYVVILKFASCERCSCY